MREEFATRTSFSAFKSKCPLVLLHRGGAVYPTPAVKKSSSEGLKVLLDVTMMTDLGSEA